MPVTLPPIVRTITAQISRMQAREKDPDQHDAMVVLALYGPLNGNSTAIADYASLPKDRVAAFVDRLKAEQVVNERGYLVDVMRSPDRNERAPLFTFALVARGAAHYDPHSGIVRVTEEAKDDYLRQISDDIDALDVEEL